jgi:hypothetical protein
MNNLGQGVVLAIVSDIGQCGWKFTTVCVEYWVVVASILYYLNAADIFFSVRLSSDGRVQHIVKFEPWDRSERVYKRRLFRKFGTSIGQLGLSTKINGQLFSIQVQAQLFEGLTGSRTGISDDDKSKTCSRAFLDSVFLGLQASCPNYFRWTWRDSKYWIS